MGGTFSEIRSAETSTRRQLMEHDGQQCGVTEGNVVGKCRTRGKHACGGFCSKYKGKHPCARFAHDFAKNYPIACCILISGEVAN